MDQNNYTCSVCKHGYLADSCQLCEDEFEAKQTARLIAQLKQQAHHDTHKTTTQSTQGCV